MITKSDENFGGRVLDRKLLEHLLQEFEEENGLEKGSLMENKKLVFRLTEETEKKRISLCSDTETVISFDFVSGDLDLDSRELTREEFDSII